MTSNAAGTDRRHQDDSSNKRPYLNRYSQSMSIDSTDGSYGQRDRYHQKFVPTLPPSPHGHHMPHGAMPFGHPYYLPHHARLPPQRNLHSVITSSFSVDEERESGLGSGRGHHREQHVETDEGRQDVEDRDDFGKSGKRMYYTRASPTFARHPSHVSPMLRDANSPIAHHQRVASDARTGISHHRQYVQRSYSSGYFGPPPELKRSYYHHSRPVSHYPGQVPPDFLPPKRPKVDASSAAKKEIVVSSSAVEGRGPTSTPWAHRPKEVNRSSSFPMPPTWGGKHFNAMPSPGIVYRGSMHQTYPQVSPSEVEESPRSWHSSNQWSPAHPDRHAATRFWDSPRATHESDAERVWGSPPRESIGHRREAEAHRRVTFEYRGPHEENPEHTLATNTHLKSTVEGRKGTEKDCPSDVAKTKQTSDSAMMLLSLPQDRAALSETLCVVRENIEVFTAKLNDVNAPAPGRKHAVVVGQVGLRCIHCRHTTRSCDRVKRAVCYPSSIKRIYRTVIDMKLDHFSQCRYVPTSLKNKLDELKAIHTRSTGTTMSYFCNAAKMLGMEDAANGVVLRETVSGVPCAVSTSVAESSTMTPQEREPSHAMEVSRTHSNSSGSFDNNDDDRDIPRRSDSMSTDSADTLSRSEGQTVISTVTLDQKFEGLVPLALSDDKQALSPLRCFLREQVCAFSATEKDIAVRAPTTFSISVGQVGIGCIHCVKQAATLRSNRAVCFPFSIGRIYQSVADIQRFHFGECKNMPTEVKDHFLSLQSASSKGSKGLATRQYWVTSAKKIGLVDTAQGIRFGRDPSKPESSKSFSLDMLALVAFSVTTASKQLVLPEDKSCIAEFLYVVMEQLQPCRFTEADRNKRRLKDVGCIGVECKHCAGQVDSRKFFWSSVSAVESNFVSVHTHMLECRMVPQGLKDRLVELKGLRKEQTAALKTGSQKAFFARVWNRLHDDESGDDQAMYDVNCEPSTESSFEGSGKATESVNECLPISTNTAVASSQEGGENVEQKMDQPSGQVVPLSTESSKGSSEANSTPTCPTTDEVMSESNIEMPNAHSCIVSV